MVLFFPNTLTNIDSILTNIIDLPNNNVKFLGDIFKTGPLRFYIDNTLVQTLDSTGITISVPKNIVDDFKITGNLVMSTEAGGGKGKIYFTDTINNLNNYITYEPSNKIKIQVGDLNINSTNTNIVGNLTLPNNSIITSFINNGSVDGSKLSTTLDLSSKTLTLPNSSITTSNITNGAVDGTKLSTTLDLSSKTISNITLPKLTQQNLVLSNKTTNNGLTNALLFDTFRDIATIHYTAGIWSERTSIIGGLSSYSDLIFGTGENQNNDVFPPERMRINRLGNVGIGENDPQQKLRVVGSTSTDSLIVNGGSTSVACGIKGRTRIKNLNGTDKSAVIEFEPSTTNVSRLFVDDSDNFFLENANSSRTNLILDNTLTYPFPGGANSGGSISFRGVFKSDTTDRADYARIIGNKESTSNYTDGVITFETNRDGNRSVGGSPSLTEKMRITSEGNVGIGLSNPTEKLDVDGKIKTKGLRVTESLSIFSIPDPNAATIEPKGCLSFRIEANNKTIRVDSSLNKNTYLTTIYNPSATNDRTLTFTFNNSGTFTYVISNNQNGGLTTNSGVSSTAYTLKKFQMQQFMIYKIGTTIYIHTSE